MALLKRRRAGLNDPMSVVARFVNACNRHDADGVASCLHPDFDSIQPMYPSRNFRGADQVRRNWQAIFDAEPGFRLTVLRSAAVEDTVWLELHGAGRDAEVAGVFVMGIQGDRVRWARIYSALVEPLPAGVEDPTAPSATLHQVPPLDESPAAENREVVEEELIAPVLDMERPGRRRRRSARRGSGDEGVEARPVAEEVTQAVAEEVTQAVAEPDGAEPDAVAGPDVVPEAEVVPEVEVVSSLVAGPEPEAVASDLQQPDVVAVVVEEAEVPEPEAQVLVWPESDKEPQPEPDTVAPAEPRPEGGAEPAPERDEAAEPIVDFGDDLWSRVDTAPPDGPPPAVAAPPKRRFGRKGR